MRVNMTIILKVGDDYEEHNTITQGVKLQLTTEQAKRLWVELAKNLRRVKAEEL